MQGVGRDVLLLTSNTFLPIYHCMGLSRVFLFVGILGIHLIQQDALASIAPGRLIVRLDSRLTPSGIDRLGRSIARYGNGLALRKDSLFSALHLYLVTFNPEVSAVATKEFLQTNQLIQKVWFDEILSTRRLPNDPGIPDLWNLTPEAKVLYNGTLVPSFAHINAEKAWDLSRRSVGGKDFFGNDLVTAVVDGGAYLNHEDLKHNIWVNEAERNGIAGVDDDQNGYVDDRYGWNAYGHNGEIPPEYHGTHVTGIAGARGNNEKGIVGVNWKSKLMVVAGSSFNTSTVMEAYGYIYQQKYLWLTEGGQRGANVVVTNSSFGVDRADCQSDPYGIWNEMYDAMGSLGILSAAATMNRDLDVDIVGDVPTGCSSPYIIKVTNLTSANEKYLHAAYGKKSIEIAAPGTSIWSTLPGDTYGTITGTSMASPHLAGAVSFLYSVASGRFMRDYYRDPSGMALVLKEAVLKTAKRGENGQPLPGLEKTVTGGKLDLYEAALILKNY